MRNLLYFSKISEFEIVCLFEVVKDSKTSESEKVTISQFCRRIQSQCFITD